MYLLITLPAGESQVFTSLLAAKRVIAVLVTRNIHGKLVRGYASVNPTIILTF
jgi:hypothetical protein